MTDSQSVSYEGPMQLELTAPAIQRLARKGRTERLNDDELARLCASVVAHIDAVLEERSIPQAKALKRG